MLTFPVVTKCNCDAQNYLGNITEEEDDFDDHSETAEKIFD